MSRLWKAALSVWDFIVGDDWFTAVGVVAALALTALVADSTRAAWVVLPAAVLALLARSLSGAGR